MRIQEINDCLNKWLTEHKAEDTEFIMGRGFYVEFMSTIATQFNPTIKFNHSAITHYINIKVRLEPYVPYDSGYFMDVKELYKNYCKDSTSMFRISI